MPKTFITDEQVRDLTDFLYDDEAAGNVEFREDDDNLGVFRTYSGRAMYGDECLGLVISDSDTFAVAFGIARWLEAADADDDLKRMFTRVSTDSMGYDTVVYWRNIEVKVTGSDGDE